MIPLIDLSQDKKTSASIKKILSYVYDSNSYILGKQLESFEKEFANYLGARFAIGVASGTDAIRLSLRALGIGYGDKVLTVSFTSPFTVIAIIEEGAIPVFCDVDEKTWTLDVSDALEKIDKRTRAIIPVHIYGNPCNMRDILRFARKYKLKVIEDACQAHGAEFSGKKIGNFGDASAFSFYPTKNLGAIGDGGIVVTNSLPIAKKIRLLRHGGQTRRFWHKYAGVNSRLDEIQAAVLSIKLKNLDKYNLQRLRLAERYKKALYKLPIKFQETPNAGKSVNHLFVARTKRREALKKFLSSQNIASDVYYPFPVHVQPAFKKYAKEKLKITEKLSRELLAFPLYPNLSYKDQDKVIEEVKNFFR